MPVPKTLVNCLSIKSGGGRAHLANVLPRLATLYHQSSPGAFVLLTDQTQRQEYAHITDCQFVTVDKPSLGGLRRVSWERKNLGRIVSENEIEVVFTPNQVLSSRTSARNVVFLGNMEPFLFHKYRYGRKPWLRNQLLRRATIAAVRKADRVIACSKFVKQHLSTLSGVSTEKLFHVYHGRDIDFAAAGKTGSVSLPDTKPFFLTCGSLLPYRRCEDVLTAFEKYCAANPGCQQVLYVAGTGTDQRYRNTLDTIAGKSPVSKRIHFLGHVDRPTMSCLYANCDACILATEIEACPITAIEALSCGCRIISGTSSPMPEMLVDAAKFFEPRNIDDLAHSMAEVMQPPLAETLPAMALKRSTAFDWDHCANETWKVLTEWPIDG